MVFIEQNGRHGRNSERWPTMPNIVSTDRSPRYPRTSPGRHLMHCIIPLSGSATKTRESIVQNEANSEGLKQMLTAFQQESYAEQGRSGRCGNKPNSRGLTDASRESGVQNKANSPMACRAEQGQFGPGRIDADDVFTKELQIRTRKTPSSKRSQFAPSDPGGLWVDYRHRWYIAQRNVVAQRCEVRDWPKTGLI